jgi:hypothetical protein
VGAFTSIFDGVESRQDPKVEKEMRGGKVTRFTGSRQQKFKPAKAQPPEIKDKFPHTTKAARRGPSAIESTLLRWIIQVRNYICIRY